jgi:PAS domain S-box-containing protein
MKGAMNRAPTDNLTNGYYSDIVNRMTPGIGPDAKSGRRSLHGASSDEYVHFFEHSPLPMLIVHADTLSVFSHNLAAAKLYSYDPEDFGGLSLKNLVAQEDFAELSRWLDGFSDETASRVWRHIRRDGAVFEAETLVKQIRFKGLHAKLLIINEANHRLAERALFASEERFAKAFHSSPIAVCITRLEDGLFIEANERFLGLSGYRREDLFGRTEVDLAFWKDLQERQAFIDTLIREGRVKDVERTFQIREGPPRHALLSAEVIGLDGCACLLVMIRDITEVRKSAETIRSYQRELRSLASQLSLAEEVERRRIAGELHDHIGQNLAMMMISVGVIREKVRSAAARKELDKMRGVLEETLNSARTLCFELSPPVLYEVGFESAVEWLAERTQKEYGIQVKVVLDARPKPLEEAVKVTLFTVVRELMNNIVKHAHATKALISIGRHKGYIRVAVKDNGAGFEVHKVTRTSRPAGFGLFSIRERITHLGGKIKISSHGERGTRVVLIAPLKTESKEKDI